MVVLNVDTGACESTTAELDRNCAPYPGARAPLWDGPARLLFTLEDAGTIPLVSVLVVEPGGGACEMTHLVDGPRVVGGFDRRDGTLAVVIGGADSLNELHIANASTGGALRRDHRRHREVLPRD